MCNTHAAEHCAGIAVLEKNANCAFHLSWAMEIEGHLPRSQASSNQLMFVEFTKVDLVCHLQAGQLLCLTQS